MNNNEDMCYYAMLDENNLCIGISVLSGPIYVWNDSGIKYLPLSEEEYHHSFETIFRKTYKREWIT